MSWFVRNSKFVKVAVGLAGVSGAVYVYKQKITGPSTDKPVSPVDPDSVDSVPHYAIGLVPLGKVLASWTTNFKPSIPWDDNWDRRNPRTTAKPVKDESEAEKENFENRVRERTPKASRHLFLIRHGQYEMEHDSDKYRILTKLGQEQARITGERLKQLNHPYDFIVHSTMTRARETADLVHEFLPTLEMKSCDLLREGAPIPPEPPVGHWRPEPQFYEEGARIEAAFRKYFHRADPSQEKDSYEVIVCHGNVIRYFVCRGLQLPPEAWLRMSLRHGSITWMTIRPSGRVSLRGLGDSGHIAPDKLSFQ